MDLRAVLGERTDERRTLIYLSVIAVAAALVYVNSVANGFAYDDEYLVASRDLVHGLSQLGTLLSVDYWPAGFVSGVYRPATLLSFAVDWTVWSGNPFGFHLTNVLLHVLVSGLVFLLLLHFFSSWAALAGGLVFAVHPVHTEAVANVVGRAELLAALFVLAACLIYTGAARAGHFSAVKVASIATFYALACLSKEVGFVLPGLLLATDLPLIANERRQGLIAFVHRRLPLFAVLAATVLGILGVRWLLLGSALPGAPDQALTLDDSFPTRLFTMARVWPRYFELLLFPLDLSADYSPAVILPASGPTPVGALGFLVVLLILTAAALGVRRAPEFSLAAAWAAIALLPVSNLVVPVQLLLAERTLYLPSVSVAIVVALLLSRGSPRAQPWLRIACAVWIVGFSIVTVKRNPVWRSTETVFEDLRRRHPESSRLQFRLGEEFHREGRWDEAQTWFRRSLETWPHNAPRSADYAAILLERGEFVEAEEMAVRAVSLNPTDRAYHSLLTLARLRRGDSVGALRAIEAGLESVGPDAELYLLQAEVLILMNEPGRAAPAQEAALRAGKDTWRAWLRLALLRAEAGDTARALMALDSARQRAAEQPLGVVDSLQGLWEGAGAIGLEPPKSR